MITSVPCRLSVAGCPGAGVPVDLARHKGRAAHCGGAVISRGQNKSMHNRLNKEQPGPGVRQTAVSI